MKKKLKMVKIPPNKVKKGVEKEERGGETVALNS